MNMKPAQYIWPSEVQILVRAEEARGSCREGVRETACYQEHYPAVGDSSGGRFVS
jgi:hypothetical protein